MIADLGCGDAALARALVPKGFTVLSFDLVSDGAFVVEADTCSKIPLPGSESAEEEEESGAQVVDVVVCALSLMSTNWVNCIREAWRILKIGCVSSSFAVKCIAYDPFLEGNSRLQKLRVGSASSRLLFRSCPALASGYAQR